MEREPSPERDREPIQPEEATPADDPEQLPEGPGALPDSGRVVEEKGRENGSEG